MISLNNFDSCIRNMYKTKISQVFSDGQMWILAFFNILEENRLDAELNLLLGICACGFHIVHNSFQRGEKASNWGTKKLLNAFFKINDESPWRRDESPSRIANYEKLTSSSKTNYSFLASSHRWDENEFVEKEQVIWPKLLVSGTWFLEGISKIKAPWAGEARQKQKL